MRSGVAANVIEDRKKLLQKYLKQLEQHYEIMNSETLTLWLDYTVNVRNFRGKFMENFDFREIFSILDFLKS